MWRPSHEKWSADLVARRTCSVALQSGAAAGLGGAALVDCLFQLQGAGSNSGADILRRLLGHFQCLIHGGLDFGDLGSALAVPVVQRTEGGVGQQFGHGARLT